jgi:hypothetical protein
VNNISEKKNHFLGVVSKMGEQLVITVPVRYHHIFAWRDDVYVEKLNFNQDTSKSYRNITQPKENHYRNSNILRDTSDDVPELKLIVDAILEIEPDYDYKTKTRQQLHEYLEYLNDKEASE